MQLSLSPPCLCISTSLHQGVIDIPIFLPRKKSSGQAKPSQAKHSHLAQLLPHHLPPNLAIPANLSQSSFVSSTIITSNQSTCLPYLTTYLPTYITNESPPSSSPFSPPAHTPLLSVPFILYSLFFFILYLFFLLWIPLPLLVQYDSPSAASHHVYLSRDCRPSQRCLTCWLVARCQWWRLSSATHSRSQR